MRPGELRSIIEEEEEEKEDEGSFRTFRGVKRKNNAQ